MFGFKCDAFKQDKRRIYTERDGLPSCNILSVAVDKDGRAWVGTDKGAAYCENGRFVPVSLFEGRVQTVFADTEGRLWLASGNELCTADGENRQQVEGSVVAISQDHFGRLRLITDEYLYKFENGCFVRWYHTEHETPLDMCCFADGEIFVATGENIKTALGKRLRWFNVSPENSYMPESYIRTVAGDKYGIVWVGTDKGLFVYDSKSYWVTNKEVKSLLSYSVNKILFGKSGKRYVCTDIGLAIYDGAKRHFYPASYWLPDAKVTAIAESDGGSTVWVGTQNGVSCIETVTMTLAEKAAVYQDYIEKYNVRDIGFVAHRKLDSRDDLGSGYVYITDNDGLRTGVYLMAQSYRYAVTGNAEALELARRSARAMLRLLSVTGVSGLTARCVRKKGDIAYCGTMPKWFDAGDYDWLGDVSSDEMVGHFASLPVYYDICASDEEKAEIADALCAVVDHILENNYKLRDKDGKYTRWGNWNPDDLNRNDFWSEEHGTNALEMLAFLKTAYHISGDEKYNAEYMKLIKEEHYALNTMRCKIPDGHTVHIDDALCFLSYVPILSYETNHDIRQCLLIGMREHWEYEQVERNPVLNVIYGSLSGECCDIDKAVGTLRELPLEMLDVTVINSTRNDLVWDSEWEQFGGEKPQLKEPLPYDEKPVLRYNRNHFVADVVRNNPVLHDGTTFLLPYWMGRHYGLIEE